MKLLLVSQSRSPEEYPVEIKLHEINNIENIIRSQEQQKEQFDKKRCEKQYDIGDIVLIQREAPATGDYRKLAAK